MTKLLLIGATVLALAPHVAANSCYYDNYDNYYCNGLSNGARAGIGVGIFVAAALLICCIAGMRRRRIQRANKAYAMQAQGQQENVYGPPPTGPGVGQYRPNSGYGPQYPQQAYGQQQQPAGMYAPPQGAPPTHSGFKAPEGPPSQNGAPPPPGYSVSNTNNV